MGNQKYFLLGCSYPDKTRNSKTQQSKLQPVFYHASMLIMFRHLLGKKTSFLETIKLTTAISEKHLKSFQRKSLFNSRCCEHCWVRRHYAYDELRELTQENMQKFTPKIHVCVLWWSWSTTLSAFLSGSHLFLWGAAGLYSGRAGTSRGSAVESHLTDILWVTALYTTYLSLCSSSELRPDRRSPTCCLYHDRESKNTDRNIIQQVALNTAASWNIFYLCMQLHEAQGSHTRSKYFSKSDSSEALGKIPTLGKKAIANLDLLPCFEWQARICQLTFT